MLASRYLCLCFCAGLLLACSNPQTSDNSKTLKQVDCTEPRPKICHKMLHPVCATRDNGIRCVTTPCDSTDEITYPNDCLACADPLVYAYRDGACNPQDPDG